MNDQRANNELLLLDFLKGELTDSERREALDRLERDDAFRKIYITGMNIVTNSYVLYQHCYVLRYVRNPAFDLETIDMLFDYAAFVRAFSYPLELYRYSHLHSLGRVNSHQVRMYNIPAEMIVLKLLDHRRPLLPAYLNIHYTAAMMKTLRKIMSIKRNR